MALHAGVKDSKRVIETACGSGLHSLFMAKTLLGRGATLVSTDISDGMLRIMKEKFEDPNSEYIQVKGNKVLVEPEP